MHVGTPGDLDFYRELCRGVDSVLELGCGWGRITREVASVVEDVVGLDINPRMIEAARREVPEASFIVSDMRNFSLERQFERVLIPYNSLYNLLSHDDLHACFSRVERHLADGGRLVLDGYHLGPEMLREMQREGGADYDLIGTFELGGRSVEVIEYSAYDVPRLRFDADYIYRFYHDDGTSESVQCSIPQRYWSPAEIRDALAECGLELESVTGDFLDESIQPEHYQMVIVATLA